MVPAPPAARGAPFFLNAPDFLLVARGNRGNHREWPQEHARGNVESMKALSRGGPRRYDCEFRGVLDEGRAAE